jgi:hypothetical protein
MPQNLVAETNTQLSYFEFVSSQYKAHGALDFVSHSLEAALGFVSHSTRVYSLLKY